VDEDVARGKQGDAQQPGPWPLAWMEMLVRDTVLLLLEAAVAGEPLQGMQGRAADAVTRAGAIHTHSGIANGRAPDELCGCTFASHCAVTFSNIAS